VIGQCALCPINIQLRRVPTKTINCLPPPQRVVILESPSSRPLKGEFSLIEAICGVHTLVFRAVKRLLQSFPTFNLMPVLRNKKYKPIRFFLVGKER